MMNTSKKVAISQSNYIPWKGYFDMIAKVDEFILYDDMQYTRRDWRNRNQIKTPIGIQWLTVPVRVKGKYAQSIRNCEIDGTAWSKKHWETILHNYKRTPYFNEVAEWLSIIYFDNVPTMLSDLNYKFIKAICKYLGIHTKISWSWDYVLTEGQSERLAELCIAAGASEYITGPSAMTYIDEAVFTCRGVQLTWFDYDGYSEYPQLWGEFTHSVTILDLLFNCGKDSHRYMKYVA